MKNIFSYAGLLLVIILTGCHSVPEPTIVNIETFQPNPNYPLAEFAAPLSDQEAWDAEGWQEATENGISTWTTQSGTAKSLGAHQDLELHLELKLSPGSSLEIRLQNAYPLVIHADASAEGHAVISGIAPSRETGRKPGLWQSIDIHFEAPVNDQMVQLPARISQINLNGIPIHEEVLLPASNTEGAGRLILQATGELSLRNLALKRLDRVTSSTSQMVQPLIPAGSIKYQYFEKEAWSQLSMFDGLAARSSGTSDLMDIKGHSKQQSDYGLIYTAHFTVPAAGTYVFLLTSDDGSKLTIDGDVRIINDGLHADETVTDTIALEAGDHEAVIHYFQGSGGASLRLDYTGEGLEVIPLFSPKKGEVVKKSTISYLIEPESEPIVQRGFLIYPPRQKLGFKETPARITHGVSVGDPGGNHFAVNAGQGTLLMFWHGEFADMANMWEGRGEWQNLSPMGDLWTEAALLILRCYRTPHLFGPTLSVRTILFRQKATG